MSIKKISNIDFSKQTIYVDNLTEKTANTKFDHVDNDYDFIKNVVLTGKITKVAKNGNSRKYYVLFENNSIAYFTKSTLTRAGVDLSDYKVGKIVKLQKIGFDNNSERTEWKLIKENI